MDAGHGERRRQGQRQGQEPVRRNIVIITGTPGVGKHAVAGLLGARREEEEEGWRIIDINEAARRAGLCGGMDGSNYDRDADTFDVDTGALARVMKRRLEGPGDYIVVGHLAPYVIPSDGVILAVVLRRNPLSLARVYAERGYGATKSRNNACAELLGVIAYDTLKRSYARTAQFDTTNRKPPEVAGMALDSMRAAYHGRHHSDEGLAIDWMLDGQGGGIAMLSRITAGDGQPLGGSRRDDDYTGGGGGGGGGGDASS